MKRNIKVGDRVFYECYDGTIDSDIVRGIKPSSYINDSGKEIKYNMLVFGYDNGYPSVVIEDYNTLSERNPKVKAFYNEKKKIGEDLLNELYEVTNAKTKNEKEIVHKLIKHLVKTDREKILNLMNFCDFA